MAIISKQNALAAIKSKLSAVKSALSDLDKSTARHAKLEEELQTLHEREVSILKESRGDESKLSEFLPLRGSIALKQSAITALKGEPSRGNNLPPTPGELEAAGAAVAKAGTAAAGLLGAYHESALAAFSDMLRSSTAAFILERDHEQLLALAKSHPDVQQLKYFSVPTFDRNSRRGYEDAVAGARQLPAIWAQLLEVTDRMLGEWSVNVPDSWLD
jgi:hypothetical protein